MINFFFFMIVKIEIIHIIMTQILKQRHGVNDNAIDIEYRQSHKIQLRKFIKISKNEAERNGYIQSCILFTFNTKHYFILSKYFNLI